MNKEFIADLITELSYRLLDGTPDLTNNDHLIVLRQVMEEKGLSHELIEKTMKNLRIPVKKNPNSTNPTKFSVDFDGAHSDQAESMPYIDAYKPQDRADQDKLPMDDRDDEERDTPADESVNELDYLDDEELTEDDIVKKKATGNIYIVKKHDPARGQVLIKRDASPEDIEKTKKGEYVEKEPEKPKKPKKIAVKLGDDDLEPERPGIYSQKSEVSKGLFSDEYETISGVEVRNLVDKDGNVIDVSTPEGRKQGAELLDERIKSYGKKIEKATTLLADPQELSNFTKKTGEKGVLLFKWLGEVGELQNLKEFLALEKRAYMLTDSAPKNDLVVLTDSGKDREIDLNYISVKTVKRGTKANKRGNNCKSEYKAFLNAGDKKDVTISVGGKPVKVDANTYVNSIIDVKSRIFRDISEENGICEGGKSVKKEKPPYGGARFNPGDSDKFLSGFEKKLYKYKDNVGNEITAFVKDDDFLKNRTISKDEIEKSFASPKMDNRFEKLDGSPSSDADKEAIRANVKQEILDMIDKADGKLTLADLYKWEEKNIGNAFHETNAEIYPTSDTGVAYFEEGSPDLSVGVVPAEEIGVEISKRFKNAKDIKDPKEQGNALVKLTGLSQRTRKLGGSAKKVKCEAYLDGMDNLEPVIDSRKYSMPIAEYSKKYLDNR